MQGDEIGRSGRRTNQLAPPICQKLTGAPKNLGAGLHIIFLSGIQIVSWPNHLTKFRHKNMTEKIKCFFMKSICFNYIQLTVLCIRQLIQMPELIGVCIGQLISCNKAKYQCCKTITNI